MDRGGPIEVRNPVVWRRGARRKLQVGLLGAACAIVPMAVVTTTSTPAGASPAPLTIAYITSVTGPGAAEDATSPAGFTARIDQQNAEGGAGDHARQDEFGRELLLGDGLVRAGVADRADEDDHDRHVVEHEPEEGVNVAARGPMVAGSHRSEFPGQ